MTRGIVCPFCKMIVTANGVEQATREVRDHFREKHANVADSRKADYVRQMRTRRLVDLLNFRFD